jgi:hypothetical protein
MNMLIHLPDPPPNSRLCPFSPLGEPVLAEPGAGLRAGLARPGSAKDRPVGGSDWCANFALADCEHAGQSLASAPRSRIVSQLRSELDPVIRDLISKPRVPPGCGSRDSVLVLSRCGMVDVHGLSRAGLCAS